MFLKKIVKIFLFSLLFFSCSSDYEYIKITEPKLKNKFDNLQLVPTNDMLSYKILLFRQFSVTVTEKTDDMGFTTYDEEIHYERMLNAGFDIGNNFYVDLNGNFYVKILPLFGLCLANDFEIEYIYNDFIKINTKKTGNYISVYNYRFKKKKNDWKFKDSISYTIKTGNNFIKLLTDNFKEYSFTQEQDKIIFVNKNKDYILYQNNSGFDYFYGKNNRYSKEYRIDNDTIFFSDDHRIVRYDDKIRDNIFNPDASDLHLYTTDSAVYCISGSEKTKIEVSDDHIYIYTPKGLIEKYTLKSYN